MSEIKKVFSTEKFVVTYTVEEDKDGQRLDQFLLPFLASFSREAVKKKIKVGDVKIFNRPYPHKASVKVYHGEKIEMTTYRSTLEDEYWNGKLITLEEHPPIIFEDDNIVIITKPPYMSTHPAGKHLFYCATVYFETKYGHTMHSVHRIDRETSGALILAKNPETANELTPLFEEKKVSKCYFFISKKLYKESPFPFTATERLGSEDDFLPRLYVHCYPIESTEGKSAQTDFELIAESDDYIVGLAYPRSGRQHQIRSHAAQHGFPLLGDKLYGTQDPKTFMRFKDGVETPQDVENMEISRHALHAMAIMFPYGINKQRQLFESVFPKDLEKVILSKFKDIQTMAQLLEIIHNRVISHFN
jgi:23S rRNA pseudouridine1911/1915/1917 synthase